MHTESPQLEVSRHKCLIYEGHPSEQLTVVIPLLTDGLQGNWRCLYLGSPEMVEMVDTGLGTVGVDTRQESSRGALMFSSDRSHLKRGRFVPQKMIDKLCALIDSAVDDGFAGLCATGDMRWELGADENFDRLLEYEARLEEVFRDRPLRGICQYRRDILPAQAVQDALVSHKSAYIGNSLNRDNLFYIPPELLLDTRKGYRSSKQGEWMCQQIVRVLNAERKRDDALRSLKESEAQQRHLAEQLAELNRDLEERVKERTAELEAANNHLESFSYSVSHDLRAPLRSIVGFSQILVQDFADALGNEGREHLDRVCANARNMENLIEGLLGLSRVIQADIRPTPVDLSALAEAVKKEICEADPERNVQFLIEKGLSATGDQVLLRAVLTNLLGNAWKFTSKCPEARIEFGQVEATGSPTYFIKDNGAGFEMKHADRLFGAFQRLHSQHEYPGTGIGLATVQRIVVRHGGRIWAKSRRGEGATFFFTLQTNGRDCTIGANA